ncbi:hypothetical protein [Piscinibacter sp.]|uniref:hypothetical protein n=1 Tax=Piscinibacter sp. TaxID=1903157 RepID=UPI002CBC61FA|nr:hypothetical protein [Albitalea sp.]HUG24831.1 hypothetical protein [Albitalea sp.]
MNKSITLMAVFLGVFSLSACERETVVNTPPPVVADQPTGAVPVPVPVPVPGPPGPQGQPGEPGAAGQSGTSSGDTNVTITPPAASAPSQ